MRSVRVYLIALVGLSVLVATAAFAVVASAADEVNRRQTEAQTRETARALSRAVDQELERAIGILSALRASEAARARDWPSLDRQARASGLGRDSWVLVQDRTGQQLVNTKLPPDAKLPKGKPPQEMWRELGSGKPRVCNLVTGVVERRITCVDMPLDEGSSPQLAISMIFRPEAFRDIITREAGERGDIAVLVDRSGAVIWRNRFPERFVGETATGPMLELIRSPTQSEIAETQSLEGVEMLSAFDRSPISGWSVIAGVPLSEVRAAGRQAIWSGSIVALAILLLSGLFAALLARRLASGVKGLTGAVRSASEGKPLQPIGIGEFDVAAMALHETTLARVRSERRQQILIGELNHRVKNTLAIVQSLAHQSFRRAEPPATAIGAFEGRLSALAAAHSILTSESWESASMDSVVRAAVRPFCADNRCDISGPDLTVSPQVAVNLALGLHELATNAAKYGALSNDEGKVAVSWRVAHDELELEWVESGGPPVREPEREGFGMRLIRRLMAAELGAKVDVSFDPAGVRCSVLSPLPKSDNSFALERMA